MNNLNNGLDSYAKLTGHVRNPLPNYVDVYNMDRKECTSAIMPIINIYVNCNAGVMPTGYFFGLTVNRLCEERHIPPEVAKSLMLSKLMHPSTGVEMFPNNPASGIPLPT